MMTFLVSALMESSSMRASTYSSPPAARSTTISRLPGLASHCPARWEISADRIFVDTASAWRKFAATKADRLAPRVSFLRGMIAVCGIGRPERVAEERGDGEPVGDRADHRGLRGAGDEAPDTGVVGEEVSGEEDERGKDEQRERERAHLLQPASALLIFRRQLGRPAGSASGAEARYGWCLLDRHRYPLLHDFSETRPLHTYLQAGSHL
jgi:hypothetical protein